MALTPRQQRFVAEYLIDLNATAAAGRAGYRHPNQQGPRLLVNVGVAAAVAAAQAARSERTAIDQDWVMRRLKEESEYTGKGASHAARVSALGLAMRHLGMLDDRHRHEHSGPGGGPIPHEHTVSATAEDVALARAILGVPAGPVHPDGGPEPVAGAP